MQSKSDGGRGDPPFIATIGYVRGLNIGTLRVYCTGKREGGWPCHHSSTMAIEGLPDDMRLVSMARRVRCEKCGTLGGAEIRPNWAEVAGLKPDNAVGWMKPPDSKSKE